MIKNSKNYELINKENLKTFIKEEGFVFKNSVIENQEYFIDVAEANNTYIKLGRINDKNIKLEYSGKIKNISSIDISDECSFDINTYDYKNLISFLANIGYYKCISLNNVKENYIKKDKDSYYMITINSIENVGNIVQYNVQNPKANDNEIENIFDNFDKKITKILDNKIETDYITYISSIYYQKVLKGVYLKKILIELDKIFVNLDISNMENTLKTKEILLNLELIEKLEQVGIEVDIIYNHVDEDIVRNIKNILAIIGYVPQFMDIKQIKEIAVRETLIVERQKSMEFSEIALTILRFK